MSCSRHFPSRRDGKEARIHLHCDASLVESEGRSAHQAYGKHPKYLNYFCNIYFFFVTRVSFVPPPTFAAYLWMRCEWPSDTNCEQLFRDHGVSGRGGPNYGVGPEWIRFSLLCRQTTFEYLMERVNRVLFTPSIPQMSPKAGEEKAACVGSGGGMNFGLP